MLFHTFFTSDTEFYDIFNDKENIYLLMLRLRLIVLLLKFKT